MTPKYIESKPVSGVNSVKDRLAAELITCRGVIRKGTKEAFISRIRYYTPSQDAVSLHIGTWRELSKRFQLVNSVRTLKQRAFQST